MTSADAAEWRNVLQGAVREAPGLFREAIDQRYVAGPVQLAVEQLLNGLESTAMANDEAIVRAVPHDEYENSAVTLGGRRSVRRSRFEAMFDGMEPGEIRGVKPKPAQSLEALRARVFRMATGRGWRISTRRSANDDELLVYREK